MKKIKKSLLKLISKKSIADNYKLIGVIGIILFIVVFSFYLLTFKDVYTDRAFSQECNEYIKVHMMGKAQIFGQNVDTHMEEFPCKTEEYTVKSNSQFEILKQVSDKMVSCYNTFYRGNHDLFNAKEANKQETFCAVCYNINFTDKTQKVDMQTMMRFQGLNGNSKEKYMDMLGGKDFRESFMRGGYAADTKSKMDEYLKKIVLDTSSNYIIIFRYQKMEIKSVENSMNDYFKQIVGGGVIGMIIPAATIVILAAVTVISGGTALALIIPAIAIGGVAGAYWGYSNIKASDINPNTVWSSQIMLAKFDPAELSKMQCDTMMGIQEPGITNK